eukprot:250502-Chlamydomonas_euryale.AAC.12
MFGALLEAPSSASTCLDSSRALGKWCKGLAAPCAGRVELPDVSRGTEGSISDSHCCCSWCSSMSTFCGRSKRRNPSCGSCCGCRLAILLARSMHARNRHLEAALSGLAHASSFCSALCMRDVGQPPKCAQPDLLCLCDFWSVRQRCVLLEFSSPTAGAPLPARHQAVPAARSHAHYSHLHWPAGGPVQTPQHQRSSRAMPNRLWPASAHDWQQAPLQWRRSGKRMHRMPPRWPGAVAISKHVEHSSTPQRSYRWAAIGALAQQLNPLLKQAWRVRVAGCKVAAASSACSIMPARVAARISRCPRLHVCTCRAIPCDL